MWLWVDKHALSKPRAESFPFWKWGLHLPRAINNPHSRTGPTYIPNSWYFSFVCRCFPEVVLEFSLYAELMLIVCLPGWLPKQNSSRDCDQVSRSWSNSRILSSTWLQNLPWEGESPGDGWELAHFYALFSSGVVLCQGERQNIDIAASSSNGACSADCRKAGGESNRDSSNMRGGRRSVLLCSLLSQRWSYRASCLGKATCFSLFVFLLWGYHE